MKLMFKDESPDVFAIFEKMNFEENIWLVTWTWID